MWSRTTGKYLLDIWQWGNKCNPSLLLSSSGSCVLEIMSARRSRVKAYAFQIMISSDLPLAAVGGQESVNISNFYGI